MSIAIVTALVDADNEDRIIAALVADGFTLVKRCHTVKQIMNCVTEISSDVRLLFITDEEFGLTPREISALISEQRALLEVAPRVSFSIEEIRQRAHEAVRKPVTPVLNSRTPKLQENFLGITGSSGSPGITSIALNLASELSQKRTVQLVDADPHRRDLHQKVGMQVGATSILTTDLSISSIDLLNLTSNTIETPSPILCIDIGKAPNMSEVMKDRRKPAREFLEIFEQCRRVVYVAQSENYSISELAGFREAMNEFSNNIKVTYVLNKIGSSNRQKVLEKSFRTRISDVPGFCLPRDHSALDRAQGQYSTLMEVAPRSSLRKAVRELSIYLDKSF